MSSTNTNPETSIRYGVIACNSLDSDLVSDLFHGPQAIDLSYAAAYEEAKADAGKQFDDAMEDATIAAAEIGGMGENETETFLEEHLEGVLGMADRDQFIEDKLEEFSDCCQIDEPKIEGTYDGVKYGISWLGGAPLLWVYEGPIGYANRLCSPCVPNAADLDGGWNEFETTDTDTDTAYEHQCYVVPRDWLAMEVA